MKPIAHRWLIKQNNRVVQIWDSIVTMTAFINGFLVTFQISFLPGHDDNYFHIFVAFVFLCDILLQFRIIRFNNKTGSELTSSKEIAKNYLTSVNLIVDVLGVLPFLALRDH